jgi:Zn-dependent protease with chaperone function
MASNTASALTYKVNPKEEIYFAIKIFFAVIMYYLIFVLIEKMFSNENPTKALIYKIYVFYAALIVLYLLFRILFLVGYLKGNAVKITPKQFPDIYNIVLKQAELLGMSKVPEVYIFQSGGLLNAYVTRFFGTNYLVIYSDILAAAYEQNIKVVEFVIGHEMGHIKRKHVIKRLLLLPASLIPFLGAAYSRACEYTCDSIGNSLCPEGSQGGMLLLAAGKGLFKKINVKAYLEQIESEDGFTTWFAEKFASHPNITKRIRAFGNAGIIYSDPVIEKLKEKTEDDYSRYMP